MEIAGSFLGIREGSCSAVLLSPPSTVNVLIQVRSDPPFFQVIFRCLRHLSPKESMESTKMFDISGMSQLDQRWPVVARAASCAVIYLLSITVVAICRIFLHPLAKFRGPRSAAASRSCLYRQKQLSFPEKMFEELHEQYGSFRPPSFDGSLYDEPLLPT